MSTKELLAKTLQNISGKRIPAEKLAKCRTTADVLKAFNELYVTTTNTSTNVSK